MFERSKKNPVKTSIIMATQQFSTTYSEKAIQHHQHTFVTIIIITTGMIFADIQGSILKNASGVYNPNTSMHKLKYLRDRESAMI